VEVVKPADVVVEHVRHVAAVASVPRRRLLRSSTPRWLITSRLLMAATMPSSPRAPMERRQQLAATLLWTTRCFELPHQLPHTTSHPFSVWNMSLHSCFDHSMGHSLCPFFLCHWSVFFHHKLFKTHWPAANNSWQKPGLFSVSFHGQLGRFTNCFQVLRSFNEVSKEHTTLHYERLSTFHVIYHNAKFTSSFRLPPTSDDMRWPHSLCSYHQNEDVAIVECEQSSMNLSTPPHHVYVSEGACHLLYTRVKSTLTLLDIHGSVPFELFVFGKIPPPARANNSYPSESPQVPFLCTSNMTQMSHLREGACTWPLVPGSCLLAVCGPLLLNSSIRAHRLLLCEDLTPVISMPSTYVSPRCASAYVRCGSSRIRVC
jgi:hypothetical protein